MTAIERINQLSHRIFNTSKSEAQTTRTSNPFAASNFQKNILTEDVFESSKAKESIIFRKISCNFLIFFINNMQFCKKSLLKEHKSTNFAVRVDKSHF